MNTRGFLLCSKLGQWNWNDVYRFPVAMFLTPLILRNYYLRSRHILPDKWYWADNLLYFWGYSINRNIFFRVTDYDRTET